MLDVGTLSWLGGLSAAAMTSAAGDVTEQVRESTTTLPGGLQPKPLA